MRDIVYKFQFFTFALIMMIFAVQYLLLMSDRGMAQAPALVILSISQFLMMFAMVLIGSLEKKIKKQNKNKIIQISFIIRTLSVLAMFFTTDIFIFTSLFLIFQICTAASYLFEGMIAQWSFNKQKDFGSFRAFFSVGIALATFIATAIVNITNDFNNLLLFATFLLILNTIGSFVYPVEVLEETNEEIKENIHLPIKFRFLLFLGALTMAISNSYVVHLNTHYMDVFGLDIATALTFGAFAMFIAAFISEGGAFFLSNEFIKKFGSKNIIFIGLLLGILRWAFVLISPNEFVFTSTYLFHGFVFVFIYVGSLSYIKEYAGNEFTDKMVMEFTVMQILLGIGITQTINIILENFSYQQIINGIETTAFLGTGYLAVMWLYILISFIVMVIYYIYFMRKNTH